MKGNTTIGERILRAELLYEEKWEALRCNDMERYDKISQEMALIHGGFWYYNISRNVLLFEKNLPNSQVCLIMGQTDRKNKEIDLTIFVGDKNTEEVKFIKKYGTFLRDDITEESTGRVGIKGLLEIWRVLPDIINWVKNNLRGIRKITGIPSDPRRKRAYSILEKLGFEWNEKIEEYYLDIYQKGGDV